MYCIISPLRGNTNADASNHCLFRFPLFVSPSVAALSPPSPVPIKERSLLSGETHQNIIFLSPPISWALRYWHDLCHPGVRHAPQVGPVGLRNPASLSPKQEKGDKVFGERSARLLTVSFITDSPDSDNYFPDDDFFPDDYKGDKVFGFIRVFMNNRFMKNYVWLRE